MGAAGQPALSAEAQAALDEQLWFAAQDGDVAAIERLAAEGASPSAEGTGTQRWLSRPSMGMRVRFQRCCGSEPIPTRGEATA